MALSHYPSLALPHLSGDFTPVSPQASILSSQAHVQKPLWTLHLGVHLNIGLSLN